MKKARQHLPMYGVGPIYVGVIVALTTAGILLACFGLKSGRFPVLWLPSVIIGMLLVLFGAWLWKAAVLNAKIDDGVKENKLVTTGVYAHVRHPVYSAFMFACTGALFLANNLWLLILPPVYWLLLTVLMKNTEEKRLKNLYGEEYKEYCKRVNRCIPWFTRRRK